jgi:L,D-transpeptidase catalytic domain
MSKILSKLIVCIITFSIFTLSFFYTPATSAESFKVPYEACELSKSHPTLTTKINTDKTKPNYALTTAVLLDNCKLINFFPVIASNFEIDHDIQNITPIGQYTFDYRNMKELAILNNKAQGYEKLKAPSWMPYYLDYNLGDFGDPIWGNSYGFHAAPWRFTAEFYGNKQIYQNGSHGCTNMRMAQSKWMYDYLVERKKEGKIVKIYNYL